jgi:hypothetical protein
VADIWFRVAVFSAGALSILLAVAALLGRIPIKRRADAWARARGGAGVGMALAGDEHG